ncbi:hypothetical protein [Caenimonas aquaedulcis]|uniref:Uncharacterized protein n=1 Tax=Caenimonas aquaedulcis TaxID=2793270 RepID=A0A931H8A5_9BURK|nr:hypothetical protein [Caenimonas aquaedulcis]MBG9390554.1 hypothetical protein [Caenimonas aquaedulcis]
METQEHKRNDKPEVAGRPTAGGGGRSPTYAPLDSVTREEARIFRQSIPAQPITRDFLQELLDEHYATRKP